LPGDYARRRNENRDPWNTPRVQVV
jgi:hypothetical protein